MQYMCIKQLFFITRDTVLLLVCDLSKSVEFVEYPCVVPVNTVPVLDVVASTFCF